ncbi:hypothetical protein PHSY_004096 [Pseudozyma hubeiensis SY62]|uniref:Uncharacterized protein n=1 Tax=Pseudozyma hubeiensis (strain SY62) TaxID=1305764 RepID=R9P575_PSEHS|nr:hypothetical protein PHSY_004096 [Pseudozyma hubeiensis SY62]GAC96516.1 hypothetical protein PHSY_004096 [Pseudozyma hubeiensis SY62]
MVNLPKPSVLASGSGSEILRGSNLPPRDPLPSSSTPPCCYQFGLIALPAEPTHGKNLCNILDAILSLSRQLTVPALFGKGDGQTWTHSEQHFPALLRWKEQQVPAILSRLAGALQQLNESHAKQVSGEEAKALHLVLGHVVCAVARYIAPTPLSIAPASPSPSHTTPPEDGWTSTTSFSQACSILSLLHQQSPLPTSTIARALLSDYIKPIFRETASSSSASTSSINPTTGRKAPSPSGSSFISHLDANLGQHRFQSAAEDGDAANLAPQKFALQVESEERNEAVGCANVFGWCLDELRLEEEGDWTEVWPLIVPALLTLLEHPQPRFRLKGSVIVHRLLNRPRSGKGDEESIQRKEMVLGKILIRTGIGSLLERALHVNLTYIHDQDFAPGLLYHSIGSLRRLILLTTHPIVYLDPQHLPSPTPASTTASSHGSIDVANDCGQRRMEAFFRLISESILSTWSYLPLPPSSTRLGRQLVDATCQAYLVLIDDLSPPSRGGGVGAVARFLDVTVDWIFRSWMGNLGFDHMDQVEVTIKVMHLASRLLFSGRVDSELGVDGSRRFMGLTLSSLAKCHISALESPLRSRHGISEITSEDSWDKLERCLSAFLERLSEADPSVKSRWAELVKLDSRLKVLLPNQSQ